MLQVRDQIALAAKLLQLSVDDVQENSEVIESNGALYVSLPVKGGESLIVGQDGSALYADSSIGYTRHLQEFMKGTRTPLDAFE